MLIEFTSLREFISALEDDVRRSTIVSVRAKLWGSFKQSRRELAVSKRSERVLADRVRVPMSTRLVTSLRPG